MKTMIRERFYPASLRREKLSDFMEAGFEDVPVSEAIRRFQEELALLGPAAPAADQHVYLFFRRLRDATRAYMAGFHCESLMDYQDRASDYERERAGLRRASQTGGSEKRQRTGRPVVLLELLVQGVGRDARVTPHLHHLQIRGVSVLTVGIQDI